MVCQPSYPLNSENASPFGTLRVYWSWADMALPPTKTTSTTAMITISQDEILVMAHSSVVICVFSSKSTVDGANLAVMLQCSVPVCVGGVLRKSTCIEFDGTRGRAKRPQVSLGGALEIHFIVKLLHRLVGGQTRALEFSN